MNKNKRDKRICELYFNNKMSFSEISKSVNLSISQVSKIVRKNESYINEKNKRKNENRIRHIEFTKQVMRKKRGNQSKETENEKAVLDYLHSQASCELSQNKTINNRAFRDWNTSIYKFYDKTKEYRLKEEFKDKTSYAIPKKIKWN